MTKPIASLLLALCSCAAVAADLGHPVTLWMAEGLSNRVYLLGSIHLLREQDHPLPSVIDDAYRDADILFMELDMDDLDPVAAQAMINMLGVIDDDRTLRDLLGEDVYAQAAEMAAAIDIPFDMLAKSEPWLAAITIEQLALARVGFSPLHGIEMYMSAKAAQDGKTIHGFESVDEQLRLLDELSIDAQSTLLMQVLVTASSIESSMDAVISAWRQGDVTYLNDVLLAEIAQDPDLYQTLIADRNHRWTDRIAALLDDRDDYLVVVGALHLVGDDGIPELLAKRGIRVSQMREPGGSPVENP